MAKMLNLAKFRVYI